MQFEMAGKSDVGRQRKRNEDNFVILEQFSLAVVADGMGGHADGNIASSLAVETLQQQYLQNYQKHIEGCPAEELAASQEKFLSSAVQEANKTIYNRNTGNLGYDGMGTTIVALQVHQNYAITAWVGDSRIYLLHNQELTQITQDHSLVGELVRYNLVRQQDIPLIKVKNIITRALGMSESVLVDTSSQHIFPNDIFLLCTDGLTESLPHDQITQILKKTDNLQNILSQLINEANRLGGADNITAALVKIHE